MKKILALTSAIVSMFAVEASASYAKTVLDAMDEARFDNSIRSYRAAIGVGAGQTLDTASVLDAMNTRATALLGNTADAPTTAQFTNLTRAYNGVAAGLTSDAVDGLDVFNQSVGSTAAVDSLLTYIAAGPRFAVAVAPGPASIFLAGVPNGASEANSLSLPAGLNTATAAVPANINAAVDANGLPTDPNNNVSARNLILKNLFYRRLVRNTDATADTNNAATVVQKGAVLGVIATNHGVTVGNAIPTEDQFTWAMATEFAIRVVMDDFR